MKGLTIVLEALAQWAGQWEVGMSSMWYILDENNKPIECDDIVKWSEWEMQNEHRRILRKTKFNNEQIEVSTVFLGLDHNYYFGGRPILWETMVFASGLPIDNNMDRYQSHKSAIKGHYEMCQQVEKYLENPEGYEDV